jgi:hypothetical protein
MKGKNPGEFEKIRTKTLDLELTPGARLYKSQR